MIFEIGHRVSVIHTKTSENEGTAGVKGTVTKSFPNDRGSGVWVKLDKGLSEALCFNPDEIKGLPKKEQPSVQSPQRIQEPEHSESSAEDIQR